MTTKLWYREYQALVLTVPKWATVFGTDVATWGKTEYSTSADEHDGDGAGRLCTVHQGTFYVGRLTGTADEGTEFIL